MRLIFILPGLSTVLFYIYFCYIIWCYFGIFFVFSIERLPLFFHLCQPLFVEVNYNVSCGHQFQAYFVFLSNDAEHFLCSIFHSGSLFSTILSLYCFLLPSFSLVTLSMMVLYCLYISLFLCSSLCIVSGIVYFLSIFI